MNDTHDLMKASPIARVTHTPAPPEMNSIPALVSRLRAHFARWPKGIVPIDKDDVLRLLDAAERPYIGAAGAVPKRAEDIIPPGAQS